MTNFNQDEYYQLRSTVDWFFTEGIDFAHSCIVSSHILPQDDLGDAVGLVEEYIEQFWPEKASMGWIVVPNGDFNARIKFSPDDNGE